MIFVKIETFHALGISVTNVLYVIDELCSTELIPTFLKEL